MTWVIQAKNLFWIGFIFLYCHHSLPPENMALRTIRNAKTKFSLILLYGILPNFGQHLANLEHDSFMQLMLDTKPK